MKAFLILASLAVSSLASAAEPTAHFKCNTVEAIETRGHRGVTYFFFSVSKLHEGKPAYQTTDDNSDAPVKMVPESSVLMLNDNWGIRRNKDGLLLDSDGDGIQFTKVQLYADSNYSSGYARVEFSDGTKAIYTKVSCQIRVRK
jgi:hypothetical protein